MEHGSRHRQTGLQSACLLLPPPHTPAVLTRGGSFLPMLGLPISLNFHGFQASDTTKAYSVFSPSHPQRWGDGAMGLWGYGAMRVGEDRGVSCDYKSGGVVAGDMRSPKT